jgi:hypothetical protein
VFSFYFCFPCYVSVSYCPSLYLAIKVGTKLPFIETLR